MTQSQSSKIEFVRIECCFKLCFRNKFTLRILKHYIIFSGDAIITNMNEGSINLNYVGD